MPEDRFGLRGSRHWEPSDGEPNWVIPPMRSAVHLP